MRPLSAHDLLRVWEVGEDRHPLDRALILLAAACPELTWDELAALSVGQRDARLLALREQTSGPGLNGFAECPRCAERMEFEVAVADLRVAVESDAGDEARELVTDNGLALRFRLPNSRDLAAVLDYQDPAAARSLLVQRCVLQASRDGVPVAVSECSTEAITELAQRMAECDPQAEVLLDLCCPTCEHRWQVLFDIVAFFWAELATQAKRLLREVHTLARAYGWREADILSMSARRRQFYLEMVT
jgi:hypothetical protein